MSLSEAFGSKPYRAYVLGALVVAYTLNVVDRVLVSILNEPIREAFHLTDFQMGLLGGPAFALLYTLLGLPVARLAETFDRRVIVAGALVIWSVMTVLCGLAGQLSPGLHAAIFLLVLSPVAYAFFRQRMWVGLALILVAAAGSLALIPILSAWGLLTFSLLLISRIGVGIGESGCIPPANSLIADYFPPERRATALSIFSLGAPIGAMLAALGGAWLVEAVDWRMAFMALGVPGVLVGLIVLLTVREPPRGGAETQVESFWDVVRHLASRPTFWHVAAGAAIASFVGYGVGQFLFAFFSRTHGLSPTQAALYFVVVAGIASAVGTFLGGFLGDRLAKRFDNALAWTAGIGLAASAPLYVLAFIAPSPILLLLALTPAALLHYLYVGPTFAITQSLVRPRMRATAIALLALIIALIGYGLGPPVIGLLSDILVARSFAASGGGDFMAVCRAEVVDVACQAARAGGLRLALIIGVAGYAWAGLHFILAARSLRRDSVG